MIMCVFVLLKDICKVLSSRSFFFKIKIVMLSLL